MKSTIKVNISLLGLCDGKVIFMPLNKKYSTYLSTLKGISNVLELEMRKPFLFPFKEDREPVKKMFTNFEG